MCLVIRIIMLYVQILSRGVEIHRENVKDTFVDARISFGDNISLKLNDIIESGLTGVARSLRAT